MRRATFLIVAAFSAATIAYSGGYTSAGFLALPTEANVGPMSAVAVDRAHGRIYVLHRGGTPLLRFDAKGKYEMGWGAGAFKLPHGLRIDTRGDVWITDNTGNTVQRFSPDGKLLQTISEANGPLKSPDDLVLASNGDIYIADTGNFRICRVTAAGKFLSQWGIKGKGPGEFATAHGLAIDSDNRIYVADRNNNRVQVFSPEGKFVAEWTGFGNPFGILSKQKTIIVSEGEQHKLVTLNQQGGIVDSWGGPEQLKLPHLMDFATDGTLYVAEVDGKRVQILKPTPAATQAADHNNAEMFEAVHRPIIQPEIARSKTASAITAEVAATLPKTGTTLGKTQIRTFIDQHVFGRMQRDKIPHAGVASDEEFVRRAWLDATGRIPGVDELQTFLASRDPQKRDKLIDKLVSSEAFIDRWTFYFEDLFRAGQRMGPGLNLFHYWLREWLTLDRPYNEVVSDLLTGAGKTSFSVPAGMYYARDFVKAKDDPTAPDAHDLVYQPDTADEFTITYGKVFLGLNLACISCHDGAHHLEKVNQYLVKKKREDFYGQAAFFGKTRQIMNWENGYQANTEFTVDDLDKGYDTKADSMVRIPKHGGNGAPRFILTGESPREGENERDELARMLTSHIQFSRAFSNRIWAEFMGFGIVEPVDEFDLDDPGQPSNPALLNALAADFQKNNYSFKTLVKTIMKSSAYQLSSRFEGEWKPDYAPYYARKFVRMLSAPELHDAIAVATGRVAERKAAGQEDGMVMQMPEPGKASADVKGFLRVFGQSNRDDMPKKTPQSALQAMLLMQTRLISGPKVDTLLKDASDDRSLVERLYLTTLSRKPTSPELEVALKALTTDRKRGAENLQWALINSPEFLFNY
jgi:DNA-binding beta-propeller fold protein YncE